MLLTKTTIPPPPYHSRYLPISLHLILSNRDLPCTALPSIPTSLSTFLPCLRYYPTFPTISYHIYFTHLTPLPCPFPSYPIYPTSSPLPYPNCLPYLCIIYTHFSSQFFMLYFSLHPQYVTYVLTTLTALHCIALNWHHNTYPRALSYPQKRPTSPRPHAANSLKKRTEIRTRTGMVEPPTCQLSWSFPMMSCVNTSLLRILRLVSASIV